MNSHAFSELTRAHTHDYKVTGIRSEVTRDLLVHQSPTPPGAARPSHLTLFVPFLLHFLLWSIIACISPPWRKREEEEKEEKKKGQEEEKEKKFHFVPSSSLVYPLVFLLQQPTAVHT